jgi:hypothetical protein
LIASLNVTAILTYACRFSKILGSSGGSSSPDTFSGVAATASAPSSGVAGGSMTVKMKHLYSVVVAPGTKKGVRSKNASPVIGLASSPAAGAPLPFGGAFLDAGSSAA